MSETKEWTPPSMGSPVWIEIPAADVIACKKFYQDLFPSWIWKAPTEEYPEEKLAMFSFDGISSLSGGIVPVTAECKSNDLARGVGVTVYHLVENIEAIERKVEELGGTAVTGKEPEGKNAWFMHLKDIEGNRFAIYETRK